MHIDCINEHGLLRDLSFRIRTTENVARHIIVHLPLGARFLLSPFEFQAINDTADATVAKSVRKKEVLSLTMQLLSW